MDARITSVQEENIGSALTADTSIGAGTITVSDGTAFDDSGTLILGSEIMPYSAVDETTGIITLIGTLASTHTADDPVYVYPLTQERTAYLITGDSPEDEEGMSARIPHALWDKIPVGIRDWDNDGGEAVEADFISDELVVMELVGQDPVVDGSYIDATTLPANPSDGFPPASSPVPIVQGGLGFLAVKWDPITNNDQVTYDVHLSTTSGFTPGPTTLAGSTEGTILFLRHAPDDTLLLYDTDYYIKLIARDIDGSAAASTQVGPTRLNPAGSQDILVGAVTAEKLESFLVLATTIGTAISGSRVEITATDGVTLYNAAGDVIVSLPIDGSDPTFRGNVITGGLTVLGNMLIQGSDNKMDKGSALTLNEGLANPGQAPVLTYGYEQFSFDSVMSNYAYGLAYDSGGSKYYTINNYASAKPTLVEASISGSQAVVSRSKDLSVGISDLSFAVGTAIIGTDVWIGYISPTSKLKAAKYDLATLTFQSSITLINSALDFTGGPAFGGDGTNMLYANWSGTSSSSVVQIRTFNTSGTQLSNNNTTGGHTYGTGVGSPWFIRGIATDGTDYFIQHVVKETTGQRRGTAVEQYNASTFAHVANKDTYIKTAVFPSGAGLAWTGANMVVMTGYETVGASSNFYLVRLGNLLWNDGTGDIWYTAYEWADATPHVTLPSPIAFASAANTGTWTIPMRRGRLTITNPALPSGVTKALIYTTHASSLPSSTALKRQSATTYIDTEAGVTHIEKDYDSGGAAPDTSNTFPGGTSNIKGTGGAITGPWNLGGDGLFRLPQITVAQRLAGPAAGDIAYDDDLDGPSFYSNLGTGQWAPIASQMAIAKRGFEVFDDFIGVYDSTVTTGNIVIVTTAGGTCSSQTGISGHAGILRATTGTTLNATGNAGVRLGGSGANASILLGNGVVRVMCLLKTPVLTTPFTYTNFGLQDTTPTSEPTVGFNLRCNGNVNSSKWQKGIGGTYTDTGIAANDSTWYMLEMVINAAGTSCDFFINGASAGTSSGAAQTGATVVCGAAVRKDTSSATSRTCDIDLLGVSGEFNAARF